MPEKNNKIPEFYMILPEKYIFARIWGASPLPAPPDSYAYAVIKSRDRRDRMLGYLYVVRSSRPINTLASKFQVAVDRWVKL